MSDQARMCWGWKAYLEQTKRDIENSGVIEKIKLGHLFFPKHMSIYPSIRCSMGCIFCFKNSGEGYCHYNKKNILLIEDWISLLKDAFEAGAKDLTISGGLEPTEYKDLSMLLDKALELGYNVTLYTNGAGSILDNSTFQQLLIRLSSIRFSVSSILPETFRDIQLTSYSLAHAKSMLDKILERINALVRLKKSTSSSTIIGISMLIIGRNVHEIRKSLRFWKKMGVDFVFLGEDMWRSRKTWFSTNQLRGYLSTLPEIEKKEKNGTYGTLHVGGGRHPQNYRFSSPMMCLTQAVQGIVVDPCGNLYPCCSLSHPIKGNDRYKLGNVKEINLVELTKKLSIAPYVCTSPSCNDRQVAQNISICKLL